MWPPIKLRGINEVLYKNPITVPLAFSLFIIKNYLTFNRYYLQRSYNLKPLCPSHIEVITYIVTDHQESSVPLSDLFCNITCMYISLLSLCFDVHIFFSLGVIWQCFLANRYRLIRINSKEKFIMAYGGIRGAIAFSLVALLCENLVEAKSIFFTTTIVVVMFTMFVQVSSD